MRPSRDSGGPGPRTKTLCRFFARGTCRDGASCRFAHDLSAPPAPKTKPCEFFFKLGRCRFGDGCSFSHDIGSREAAPSSSAGGAAAGSRSGTNGGGLGSAAPPPAQDPVTAYRYATRSCSERKLDGPRSAEAFARWSAAALRCVTKDSGAVLGAFAAATSPERAVVRSLCEGIDSTQYLGSATAEGPQVSEGRLPSMLHLHALLLSRMTTIPLHS